MEDKLLTIFQDVSVQNHYGLTVRHPEKKWVMAKDFKDEFKQINIEGGAVFHRVNGKTRIDRKGCNIIGTTPIVSVIVTKGCILEKLNEIHGAIKIKSFSLDTEKNIKYELSNDQRLIGYECLMIEHDLRDVVLLDGRKPLKPQIDCAVAKLIVNGIEIKEIASGGSFGMQVQQDGVNVGTFDPNTNTWNVPSGGICPDATVENSDQSYSDTVASGGTLILPDTEYIFIVDGVPQTPIFLPTLKNETINIVWQ